MKLSRGAIALYVGLVFVCGGVLGFFANRLYTVTVSANPTATKTPPNPDEFLKQLVAEYTRRLNLSDAQVSNLRIILDTTRARVSAEQKAQRDRSLPAFEQIRKDQIDHINAMLSSDQKDLYKKLLDERRAKRLRSQRPRSTTAPHGPGF